MSKICAICERKSITGRQYARRGMAKAKGGAGIKVTRTCHRLFHVNLKRVKIILNGVVRRVYVCTNCIKSGKITKA